MIGGKSRELRSQDSFSYRELLAGRVEHGQDDKREPGQDLFGYATWTRHSFSRLFDLSL